MALGLAVVLAVLSLAWLASLRLRDASIADVCWGPGFVLLAWLYVAIAPQRTFRSWLIAALVSVWGARLAAHIFRRSRGKGEDSRYAAMRDRHGVRFWWRSLFIVFWLQGALMWFVSLPLLAGISAARPAGMTGLDAIGIVAFGFGFGFEVIGDRQLRRFRSSRQSRGEVLDTGLWRYTRHPNYFGDAVLWWGLYIMATAVPGGWRTILSPCLMTFLLVRVSGVALLEEGLKASKPGYADYIARTPAFFPWRPHHRR